jgi:hypothetical protein
MGSEPRNGSSLRNALQREGPPVTEDERAFAVLGDFV